MNLGDLRSLVDCWIRRPPAQDIPWVAAAPWISAEKYSDVDPVGSAFIWIQGYIIKGKAELNQQIFGVSVLGLKLK